MSHSEQCKAAAGRSGLFHGIRRAPALSRSFGLGGRSMGRSSGREGQARVMIHISFGCRLTSTGSQSSSLRRGRNESYRNMSNSLVIRQWPIVPNAVVTWGGPGHLDRLAPQTHTLPPSGVSPVNRYSRLHAASPRPRTPSPLHYQAAFFGAAGISNCQHASERLQESGCVRGESVCMFFWKQGIIT
jgi:hypothetical protein